MDHGTFLRPMQWHIYDYGVPSLITCNNGPQIVQGINLIQEILSDTETINYLKENNINSLKFQTYPSYRNF